LPGPSLTRRESVHGGSRVPSMAHKVIDSPTNANFEDA
jgi:hypothetical protein